MEVLIPLACIIRKFILL